MNSPRTNGLRDAYRFSSYIDGFKGQMKHPTTPVHHGIMIFLTRSTPAAIVKAA